MRLARTHVLVFFLVTVSPTFAQQTSTTVQRDPQAVAILQRSFTAMGANSLPADLTLTGQIIRQRALGKATGTIVLTMTGPDIVRVETKIPDESAVHIVNGNHMRQIRGAEDDSLPYHASLNHPFQYVPLLSSSLAMTDPNLAVFFVGEENMDGTSVYHVRTEKVFPQPSQDHSKLLAKLTGTDFFVDKSTLLLLKRTQELPTLQNAGQSFPIEFRYSDYHQIQGLMIPFTVSVYVNNQKSSEIQFSSATLDTGVSASEFEVKP